LPRVVVEDKEEKVELSEPVNTQEEHSTFQGNLSDSLRLVINSLKESIDNSESPEKSVIFADSLAKAYKNALFYDSAAIYLADIADEVESKERLKIAGDAYFEAFNFAVSESKRNSSGERARYYYDKVLEIDPNDLDTKANLAVTYVTSQSPMQGIGMLREILEVDPSHERALFNLGLLSITSGQLDRAVERFSTLLANYPDHYEARLYLGYCYMELGQVEKAKAEFERVIDSDAEQTIKNAASGYLESINN